MGLHRRAAGRLPEADWQAKSPLPGWDVKAVVAHLIGTESFLMGVAAPEPDVDVSALGHVRNPIGVMNEFWVRHLCGESGASLLERFRNVTEKRRKALTDLSNEEWNAATTTPAGPDSYGRFMRIRAFDCWMHEQDIRHALQQESSDEQLAGPASRLSLDEISTSMGFVVGKLASSRGLTRPIRADRTADPRDPRQRRGSCAGCRRLWGQEPTATIRMDGLQFTRLAGGRPKSPARSQDIEFGGDKDLAAHIVERLNFVI